MSAATGLLILSLAMAFIFACAGAVSLGALGAATASASRVQKSAGAGSVVERVLRNGVAPLLAISERLEQMRLWKQWCERVSSALVLRDVETSEQACGTLGLCLGLSAFAGGGILGSPVAGVGLAALVFFGAQSAASRALEARREAVRDALPDTLRMMSACFHAGFSLEQTFAQVASESRGPLARIFENASRRLQTGSTAGEALDALRREGEVSDLAFLSVALEVQHRAGGSMQHVFEATRESLQSELELKRSLKVHTAQARLSARVVVGVTIAMVVILCLLTDDFLAPFFSSAVGLCLLVVAIAMQAAGIVIVRRMLNVEVD